MFPISRTEAQKIHHGEIGFMARGHFPARQTDRLTLSFAVYALRETQLRLHQRAEKASELIKHSVLREPSCLAGNWVFPQIVL
jgi:hypothetical protein